MEILYRKLLILESVLWNGRYILGKNLSKFLSYYTTHPSIWNVITDLSPFLGVSVASYFDRLYALQD
jgi:hypothetical protein